MSASFALHPQLSADCHVLGSLGTSRLLLHRNAAVPWFILVPEVNASELYELPSALRRELDETGDALARFVKRYFNSDKINVAALGNVVPQLHVHVIGRRRDDPCWPKPIWGHLEIVREYTAAQLDAVISALRSDPALHMR